MQVHSLSIASGPAVGSCACTEPGQYLGTQAPRYSRPYRESTPTKQHHHGRPARDSRTFHLPWPHLLLPSAASGPVQAYRAGPGGNQTTQSSPGRLTDHLSSRIKWPSLTADRSLGRYGHCHHQPNPATSLEAHLEPAGTKMGAFYCFCPSAP